ncbi:UspA domain-containing protein (plasmid) [Stanieria cyanosphaera PCC 7437]|uniref:Universal stress protein n=1 Tax=Stanieria cyanosphaera (strain ATCC 29371 / PCC 7437) TaxID=111780 RepID=K9Y1K4_STAC7|nr:universal stress protein [Stanieria cyanosphaera]AFZ38209.1 UspA domain-containing protein [Stanieria cyanosphaera PCC 7437]
MFDKIIAAVDTSKVNKHVFSKALELAKLTGAQLKILHVLSPEENGCPDVTGYLRTYYSSETFDRAEEHGQQLWERFTQKCLQMVQSYEDEAEVAGVNTECCQVSGSPGLTICEVARSWGADLIVIGRRGHLSKLEELVLGSVSKYVLHHASCAVLVVPRFG